MAVAEEVVVDLIARTDRLERQLRNAERTTSARLDRITAVGQGFTNKFNAILGGVSALALAKGLLAIADEAKNLDAQLRLATAQTGNFAQATDDVRRIAQETRSGLSDTVGLYGAFTRNAKELGITQLEAARATETVTKTFRISGGEAAASAGAMRQLIQAFQSGTLRGDEFNSVNEQAPRVMQLLADSMGKPVSQLRAMAEAGELTADKLVVAFTDRRFTDQIDEEFKTLPVTFSQAMEQVQNAAVITFGAFDRGGEFSTALANFFTDGADGFAGIEADAENAGISIRSTFDALSNAFDPLGDGASNVFEFIKGEAEGLRLAIADIIGAYDSVRNAGVAMSNKISDLVEFGSGGLIEPTRGTYSDNRGTFLRRAAEGDARRRTSTTVKSFREQGIFGGGFVPVEPTASGAGRPRARPKTKTGPKGANAEVGRDWTATEVAALLRSGGFQVNGTDRTAAQQQAQIDRWMAQERAKPGSGGIRPAPVGSSSHERGAGVDIGAQHSMASIKDFLKSKGVPIGQLLNEGDHKHLTIGGKGGGSAEAIAKRAEAARLAEERRLQAFNDEEYNLQRDLLDAKSALINSAELRAQAERDQIEADRVAYAEDVASKVAQKKLRDEGEDSEAKRLLILNDQIAAERTKLVDIEEAARKRRLSQEVEQQAVDASLADNRNQQDLLQSRADLADTLGERKNIELKLLDLQFEEEKIRLRAIIAESERLNAIQDATDAEKDAARTAQAAADLARKRLGILPELQGNARAGVERANEGPMATWRRQAAAEAADLNTTLERLEVDAINRATDGFGELTAKILGAKGAVGDLIAELAKLAFRQAVLALLPGGGGIPGFASGGSMILGGQGGTDRNTLQLNGRPIARVSRGERMDIVPQGRAIRPVSGQVAPQVVQSNRTYQIHVSADHSVSPAGFARSLAADILQRAQQMDAGVAKGVLKAVPMRMGQYGTDGT